ncbi:MAG: glycosyltransferase family 39 protein, partial [Candidatus Sericytochromatia bacterium]
MPFRFAVPALAALSLLVSCLLISPKKLFWFDEIASYLLASAPSVPRLLAAVADQTDTAPPLFHLIIWGWTRLFPPGELSLRLVSAFGMAIALLVLWRTMARTYAFWPVALGVLNAFCLSTLLLLQNAEARFYGVFVALTAMALWAYDRLGREESWKLLAANALLHAALVLVHVYGFFYSGALLGAFVVRDLAAGKLKPRVYLTVLAGWLAFVPWIPSYRWQMQVGQPHSWMPVPTPEMLMAAYSFSLPLPLILIGLFFVGALFTLARQRGASEAPAAPEARHESSLWIAAFALLTVPVAAWVFSRLAFPIFQDRYTLPALASWAILFAALASRLLPARPFEGWRRPSL